MAINDPTPPEPTRLTPLDQAIQDFDAFGEDFAPVLHSYLSSFPEEKRYVFAGPGYLLIGHEETRLNPHVEDSPLTDPYWFITYGLCRIGHFSKLFTDLMPYPLDRVGFARYAKYPERGVRFINTERLKHYGIKTKSTSAASAASASTSASYTYCASPHCEG